MVFRAVPARVKRASESTFGQVCAVKLQSAGFYALSAVLLTSCASPAVSSFESSSVSKAPTTAPTTTFLATTTTVAFADPGLLRQTTVKPQASGQVFNTNVNLLWNAIVSGDPQVAEPFFFPLAAYVQVKAISDPVHDYDTRLIYAYDMDLLAYHEQLLKQSGSPKLVGLSVPESSAAWILPGVEYNKGSYWRVYGSKLYYSVAGVIHFFPVFSLISWRGRWYVVHVGPPTA